MKPPVRKAATRALVSCLLLAFAQAVSSIAGGQYLAFDLGYGRAYDINLARTVAGASTSSGVQRAFSYSAGVMTDLGVLSGMDSSIGYAINESDNIVGVSFSSDGSGGYPQGFRHKIDTMADIGTLGFHTYAYDINSSGIVVGESVKNAAYFPSRAFVAVGGVLTDLGTLGGLNSAASGINSGATVVGWADNSNGVTHAFNYRGGEMTDLGSLEVGGSSHASDINDLGLTVGWASLDGNDRGFVYRDGVMIALGTLGGANSLANAVNLGGVVVGNASTSGGGTHAFVYKDGLMTDLAPYLATLGITGFSEALGINDLGDIVGSGDDVSGQRHAFVLLAVPEPTSASLLVLGIAGWLRFRRRFGPALQRQTFAVFSSSHTTADQGQTGRPCRPH
jgi:probable HAF family extracellular repeat protein